MKNRNQHTTVTNSANQTELLAAALAANFDGSTTIQLIGDLGAGKTQFVRGLAAGIASDDQVQSPSFMLQRIYNGDPYNIHHFDLYRLDNPGVLADELAESLADPDALVAIEWAQTVADLLPKDTITIEITASDTNKRQFVFTNLNQDQAKAINDFNN